MTPERALMLSKPTATPRIPVSNGSPADTNAPKVMVSTKNAMIDAVEVVVALRGRGGDDAARVLHLQARLGSRCRGGLQRVLACWVILSTETAYCTVTNAIRWSLLTFAAVSGATNLTCGAFAIFASAVCPILTYCGSVTL